MKKSSISEFVKECNKKGITYAQGQQLETLAKIKQLEKAKDKEPVNNSNNKDR